MPQHPSRPVPNRRDQAWHDEQRRVLHHRLLQIESFREYVFIIEFAPSTAQNHDGLNALAKLICSPHELKGTTGVVVKRHEDPDGLWRRRFNGVYLPAGTIARSGEFRLKLASIARVWEHRAPGMAYDRVVTIADGPRLVEETAAVFEHHSCSERSRLCRRCWE